MNGLNLEELRKAVRETRLEKGWTQQQLADKASVSRSLLAKFENGSRNLSAKKIDQLLDCLLTKERKEHLEGIVDYLTIHFFSTDYEMLIDKVLNISMNHMVFHETKILGYDGRYNLLNAIDIRVSEDERKGSLFELKGTGCRYLAGWLNGRKETWSDFINRVFEFGGNFTRIDLAINDHYGYLDIPDLVKKIERNEFRSAFRIGDVYQSKDFANHDSHGTTIYFGSRKSLMHFCFYQKDHEQRRKKGIALENAPIINRYELRARHEKAQELARKLRKTENFEPLIFGLINRTICFYDRPPESPQAKIDKNWNNFINNHEEISLSMKADPMTLEKSFNWILNNVAPSLKLIREFGKVYQVNLLGLILQATKLNSEGEKMLNAVHENPEWFKGEIKSYRRVLERKLEQQRKAEHRKQ
ncbi:replication initiation factor domain-containing protein [Enterococcus avium]|uniref:replication initiation factor domain-containing protein n=1 Tax=Enterococcus avium TaxID=33945 RepID=UPI001A974C37|nr:replication initiation factor domain-containing protein [Enterococcus avium]